MDEIPVHDVLTGPQFRPVEISRTTWFINCYHQMSQSDAKQFQAGGDLIRTLNEEAYERTVRIAPGQSLDVDFGFLNANQIASVILVNVTGQNLPANPSEELKKHIKEGSVLIKPFELELVTKDVTILPLRGKYLSISLVNMGQSEARIRYFGIPL